MQLLDALLQPLLRQWPEDEPAWQVLLGELHAHWTGPRAEAAGKLAELGPAAARAVVPLTALLQDALDRARAAAARALGRIGPAAAGAIPDLEKACHDPEPNVRKEAALALERLARPQHPSDKEAH